jgi:hypothetical protein
MSKKVIPMPDTPIDRLADFLRRWRGRKVRVNRKRGELAFLNNEDAPTVIMESWGGRPALRIPSRRSFYRNTDHETFSSLHQGILKETELNANLRKVKTKAQRAQTREKRLRKRLGLAGRFPGVVSVVSGKVHIDFNVRMTDKQVQELIEHIEILVPNLRD